MDAAAVLVSVCRRTIYNWISQGRVRAVRIAGGQLRVVRASLVLADAAEEKDRGMR